MPHRAPSIYVRHILGPKVYHIGPALGYLEPMRVVASDLQAAFVLCRAASARLMRASEISHHKGPQGAGGEGYRGLGTPNYA